MKEFSITDFFDTTDFTFASIFVDTMKIWEPINAIDDYIQNLFASGKIRANYKDRKDVFVGEGTVIHHGVAIVGPAIIGKNCYLGHVSLLRDGCILGDGVHIGHGVEIKHSLFLNNSTAAHLNYIGDSLIGNNVNIAGGAITANFRLDKKGITIQSGEEKIATNMVKLGAIIGDNSMIGVNAVMNPGTVLGKGVAVYPLTSVRGTHQDGEVIR